MVKTIKQIIDEMITEEPDSMEAKDDSLVWLVDQLAHWPTRVNEEYTTNIRFLMQSAARTIASLMPQGEQNENPEAEGCNLA